MFLIIFLAFVCS